MSLVRLDQVVITTRRVFTNSPVTKPTTTKETASSHVYVLKVSMHTWHERCGPPNINTNTTLRTSQHQKAKAKAEAKAEEAKKHKHSKVLELGIRRVAGYLSIGRSATLWRLSHLSRPHHGERAHLRSPFLLLWRCGAEGSAAASEYPAATASPRRDTGGERAPCS
eukprot:scaffold868_cov249-Pinguiococcus_pyrenoidosus.AAC.8